MEPVPNQSPGQPEVAIVSTAFSAAAIRRDGHRAWIAPAAAAGAAGFEVRHELFASEAEAAPSGLRALGSAIAAHRLWSVWSTPAALYTDDGTLDTAALTRALDQARALGARIVKLQLGGFAGDPQTAALAACLRDGASNPDRDGAQPRLLVENGQLPAGGTLAQFTALFDALDRDCDGRPAPIGMTFDIGNWRWLDQDPLDAARRLAPHVEYIHCKAVAGDGARRFPVAPAADDPVCTAVFPLLPRSAPRGIEFPFAAERPDADASRYVAWLGAA